MRLGRDIRAVWAGALWVAATLAVAQAKDYYWDGPDGKSWDKLDNAGLSWWRSGTTNGAYSAALPSDGDTGYDLKTTLLAPTINLGSASNYATIHLGPGAQCGNSTESGRNPLVIDAGNATFGSGSGDKTWRGPITINGNSLTLVQGESYRTLYIDSAIDGPGRLICSNSGTIQLLNWQSSYTGGTTILPGHRVEIMNSNTNGGGYTADGLFGTGPVDVGTGGSVYHLNTAAHGPFVNTRSSFYGSAGGTNLLYTGGCDWELYGGAVTWRPGPRDRSGLGATIVSNMPALRCSADTNGACPTLQLGVRLGGACDQLLLAPKAPGSAPDFRPQGCLTLALDNIETNRSADNWRAQPDTRYAVVLRPSATNATSGTFANTHLPQPGQPYQQIVFTNGYFASAFITYLGRAATGAITGGQDVLLWNLTPSPTDATLYYWTTAFSEAAANDGTIDNSSPLRITLYHGTLAGTDGEDFAASGRMAVSNLPAGLTAVVTRASATELSVTLAGTAARNNAADTVTNLTFAFGDAAFAGLTAAAISNAVRADLSVSFQNPLLTYSGSVFTEAPTNDGSIGNSLTLTLSGAGLAGTNGEDFVPSGRLAVSNLPAGLTATIVRASASQLVATLTGRVVSNNAAASVTNLTFAFRNSAFSNAPAAAIVNAFRGDLQIVFLNPAQTYSGTVFTEAPANDGSISNTLTITLAGDRFAGTDGDDFLATSRAIVSNLPPGLTACARRLDDSHVLVSLNGAAVAHNAADSVTNAALRFVDAAFAGANAAIVGGATRSDLAVHFNNPALTYDGTAFVESDVDDGSIANSLTITLAGDGFAGANGEDFVVSGRVTAGSVPSGLTACVVRAAADTVTFALVGHAQAHATADSITNLSLAFQGGAFAGGNAAIVSGAARSDLAVQFATPVTFPLPITVKECAGVGATGFPVTVVVPLPRGVYQDPAVFHLVDGAGSNVPCQVEVLNRWWVPDNSLRHVAVHFQPVVAPFVSTGTGTNIYFLRNDGPVSVLPPQPVQVTEDADRFTVDTGPLRFTVPKNGFTLLQQVWLDLNSNGVFEASECMLSNNAAGGGVLVPWSAGGPVQFDSARTGVVFTVEERGPLRAVICASALTRFTSTNDLTHGWAVRLYAYAGQPCIKIDYQLQNSAKNVKFSWPLYFHSLDLNMQLNLAGDPLVRIGRGDGTVDSRNRGPGVCLAQDFHNHYRIADTGASNTLYDPGTLANSSGPDGFLDASDGTRGVLAATRYFWQMWPNGLQLDGTNVLSLQLFPAWSSKWYKGAFATNGLYWLNDMQHVYKESLLWFHGPGVADSNLVGVARTFAHPPVGTLPVGWYRASAATFDLDSVMPCRTRFGTTDARLPIYNNSGWFTAGNNGQYEFGWGSFRCDADRKEGSNVTGGWPYSVAFFAATENPADYWFAEEFAIGELNVRGEWMAGYTYSNDFNLLHLTENPYGGGRWREFDGNTMPWLAADYLPGTGRDAAARDDEHCWLYHVEEAYYFTANPWIRDWYRFIGEFRRTRLNQRDPYPDMSNRAVGHSLANSLQAYRVTGDTNVLTLVRGYIAKYLRPGQVGLRDGGRGSTDGYQLGYLNRAAIGYLHEVEGWDPQGWADVFQFVSGISLWNVNYGNFPYYFGAAGGGQGVSNGTGVSLVDPQVWYYWHTGKQNVWDHARLFVDHGINGGIASYNGPTLRNWPNAADTDCYVGRWYSYVLNGARVDRTPPPAVQDLRAWTNAAGVTAVWTAPAGAARYHVVCSTQSIVEAQTLDSSVCNWWAADAVACTLAARPGQPESWTFSPAATNPCYVAVFSFDAANNMSAMSAAVLAGPPPPKPFMLLMVR